MMLVWMYLSFVCCAGICVCLPVTIGLSNCSPSVTLVSDVANRWRLSNNEVLILMLQFSFNILIQSECFESSWIELIPLPVLVASHVHFFPSVHIIWLSFFLLLFGSCVCFSGVFFSSRFLNNQQKKRWSQKQQHASRRMQTVFALVIS